MDANFLIGGDPEFPIYDKKLKKYITAENLVSGSKEEPSPIAIDGCFEQLDCVGIEFTLPPAPEFWIYQHTVNRCIGYTNNWLSEVNSDYQLKIVSSAKYHQDQLLSETANIFGCEPSYSVYTRDISVRPDPVTLDGLRSFGYHIHYGWGKDWSKEELLNFIILNDIFLGIPSVFKDKDLERRKLYGNLSDHRIITKDKIEYKDIKTSNRVEYRTLGAGMCLHAKTIENGIDKIKDVIRRNSIEEVISMYYNDLEELDESNFDKTLCENLKDKLIENNHWNG
jgi:hypothetical protein